MFYRSDAYYYVFYKAYKIQKICGNLVGLRLILSWIKKEKVVQLNQNRWIYKIIRIYLEFLFFI